MFDLDSKTVEDANDQLTAYEFKWNARAKVKSPQLFLKTYPGSGFKIISPDNLEDFLVEE
ncbi:MAG: hypothetical protein KF870_14195 [Leadbetterella sp.]|nr:hypothetical protein [Leadbetterella sp.]